MRTNEILLIYLLFIIYISAHNKEQITKDNNRQLKEKKRKIERWKDGKMEEQQKRKVERIKKTKSKLCAKE